MAKALEKQDGSHALGNFQESQLGGMSIDGFNKIDILVLKTSHVVP